MPKNNYALTRDYPAYIKEGDEHLWPRRGQEAEMVGFIPEGWEPEQIISGEYHKKRLEDEAKEARKASK